MTEIFLYIVNMSITATILAVVVLLLRLLLKKSPKWISVLLWGLVALRLICPFAVESSFSLMPKTDWVVQESVKEEDLFLNSAPDSIPAFDSSSFGSDITVQYSYYPLENSNIEIHKGISISFILSCVWAAGMAVLILHTIISTIRLHRSIGAAIRIQDNVWESSAVESPFVLGMIRPRIYVPRGMSEEKLAYVIAHEQAHIRRKDHWWKPLGFLLLTIHWFNPVLWLAYILLCRDIEMACDERVIKEYDNVQRADYSEALLECSINRKMISACPLAFGEVGVKTRIKSVLNYKKPAFWIVVLAVVACGVTAVCFLTNPLEDGTTLREIEMETVPVDMESAEVCISEPPNRGGIDDPFRGFSEKTTYHFYGTAIGETVYTARNFANSGYEMPYLRKLAALYKVDDDSSGLLAVYPNSVLPLVPYIISIENKGSAPLRITVYRSSDSKKLESHTVEAGKSIVLKLETTNYWYMGLESVGFTGEPVSFRGSVSSLKHEDSTDTDIFGTPRDWFIDTAWEKAQKTAIEKGLELDRANVEIFYSENGEYVGVEFYEEDNIRHVRIAFFRDENGNYSMEPPEQTTISTESITESNPVIAYQDDIIEKAAESIFGAVTVYASGIDKLEQIPTATVGISEEILLYRLDYWITKGINGLEGASPEDIWRETVYFAMFNDWTSDTWVRLGTITEDEIDAKYGTEEMISKYGNKYTAAASHMKLKYYELVRTNPVEFTAVITKFDPAFYENGMMSLNIVEFITPDDTERIAELELSDQDMISGYYIHDEDESITLLKMPEDTEYIFFDWSDAYTDETDERYVILGERWISTRDAELFYEYWLPYADSPGYPFVFTASEEKVIVKEIPLM